MKFTYVAASDLKGEGFKNVMRKYMKDQRLNTEEIKDWLDWWDKKKAKKSGR